jgi:hypothetical protein
MYVLSDISAAAGVVLVGALLAALLSLAIAWGIRMGRVLRGEHADSLVGTNQTVKWLTWNGIVALVVGVVVWVATGGEWLALVAVAAMYVLAQGGVVLYVRRRRRRRGD